MVATHGNLYVQKKKDHEKEMNYYHRKINWIKVLEVKTAEDMWLNFIRNVEEMETANFPKTDEDKVERRGHLG